MLVDNTLTGFANISNVIGQPIEDLLAKWSAMLYADDQVTSLDPILGMTSWNLFDVYYGTFGGSSLFATTRLTPLDVAFADFSNTANVRAASTYYTRISGAGRPATAVRIRDLLGGVLPSQMQVWILREQ